MQVIPLSKFRTNQTATLLRAIQGESVFLTSRIGDFKLVLHDYNHCGHYLYTAAVLFSRIKNKTADWVNLRNLWILRDCVRENYNHGIGVDDIIFGEDFDGENLDTLTPLTKKRFDYLCKRIKELDPYATI